MPEKDLEMSYISKMAPELEGWGFCGMFIYVFYHRLEGAANLHSAGMASDWGLPGHWNRQPNTGGKWPLSSLKWAHRSVQIMNSIAEGNRRPGASVGNATRNVVRSRATVDSEILRFAP